jgi:hypothetical protein
MPLLALADGPFPIGDVAAAATCIMTLATIVSQTLSDTAAYYTSNPYRGGGEGYVWNDEFSQSTLPPQTRSAPHGQPQPVPPPLSFPAPQEQAARTTTFPLPTECPVNIPDLVPAPVPVLSESFPLPQERGPVVFAAKAHINERHFLRKITQHSRVGSKNTIILPGYEHVVYRDLERIDKGDYDKIGSIISVDGRLYEKEKNNTYFPITNQTYKGFSDLSRTQYRSLLTFIKYSGDKKSG